MERPGNGLARPPGMHQSHTTDATIDAQLAQITWAFDRHFAAYGLSLPAECLATPAGRFDHNGWRVNYRLDEVDGAIILECFVAHAATNDRLYHVHPHGRVELVDSSTDGILFENDRRFYERILRRGLM